MYTLQQMLRAEDSDIFDVLAHIAFNTSMVTREKRAVRVRGNEVFFKVFKKLEARKFLEFVLDRYVSTGVEELDQDHLGELIQISGLKTATEAVAAFGNVKKMQQAFLELQQALYENIA
jgi:type I restriction enzyme R subunit